MTAPHRAKKSLGQNFLTDPAIQQRIADAIEPVAGDVILEIGPGLGALTKHLAGRVKRLVLAELDDDLAESLEREYRDRDDVVVIHGDVLDLDLCEVFADDVANDGSFKVIGNIPYNITTPIIFKLLERRCRPSAIVLMVQRELAERVISPAGNKTYGALSVGVQALADVKKLFHVGRGSFRPAPNVDSAVMRITPHNPPKLTEQEEKDLRALTRAAFSWRRKQLQKILRASPSYEVTADDVAYMESETGIHMDARPETLAPQQFVELARVLRTKGLPSIIDDVTEWE